MLTQFPARSLRARALPHGEPQTVMARVTSFIALLGCLLLAAPASAHTIDARSAAQAVRTAAETLGQVDQARCWRPFKAIRTRDPHRAVCVAWWIRTPAGESCTVFYEARVARHPNRRVTVAQIYQPWCASTPPGAAAVAAAARGDRTAPLYARMKQRFTTAKPGAWTGWRFDGALKPSPPGVQPPPQRSATFVFPRGTRFDLAGAPNCTATDEQIMREGLGACPQRAEAVSGQASLFLGAAGVVDARVHAYVARPGLAIAFATTTGSVLRVVRATIHRNRVDVILPAVPLPGGYEVSVTGMSLEGSRFGTRKHPGLRTPRRCPSSGRWTFTYLPRYDQPHGVQRSTSSVRCRHNPPAPSH